MCPVVGRIGANMDGMHSEYMPKILVVGEDTLGEYEVCVARLPFFKIQSGY